LLAYVAPQGEVTLPERIAARTADLPAALREDLRAEYIACMSQPAGVGLSCADGMIDQLKLLETPPVDTAVQFADEMFQYPAIRRDLNGK
jgi:hypothetical protein